MANNCFISVRIRTVDLTQSEELCRKIKDAANDAFDKFEGIFIGCEHRYLFDAEIFHDRDTIFLTGWVKWCFHDEEVRKFLGWLKKQIEVTEFHLDYEESGCMLYGEYFVLSGSLLHTYIPEGFYPMDDEGENLDVALEAALQKYGVTVEVKTK